MAHNIKSLDTVGVGLKESMQWSISNPTTSSRDKNYRKYIAKIAGVELIKHALSFYWIRGR